MLGAFKMTRVDANAVGLIVSGDVNFYCSFMQWYSYSTIGIGIKLN